MHTGFLDVFVRKDDFDGNELWTRQFGTPGFAFTEGVIASRGRVIVVGAVEGALPGQNHGGNFDAFVRMYDSDGNELWTHQFRTSRSEDLRCVGVDPASPVIYAGMVSLERANPVVGSQPVNDGIFMNGGCH